jgi:dCTP deaminase
LHWHIDPKVEQEDLTELVEVDGERFILHPGEFVLGGGARLLLERRHAPGRGRARQADLRSL